jgi:methionine-rich copper-binding protein CopC
MPIQVSEFTMVSRRECVTLSATAGAAELGVASVEAGHPDVLIVPIAKPVTPGVYTVHWHAVSADTHGTQGTFKFTVK